MNKLFNKLAAYFMAMTGSTVSKKECEWQLNDLNQCGLFFILLVSIVLIIECSAWFIILAIALIYGWSCIMKRTRTLVLTMLYPKGEDSDDNLEDLMAQMDSAIKLLENMK